MANRKGLRIHDCHGRTLRLGRLLKSGGAGSVFLVENAPGEVAKLYHPNADLALYERKLGAMLKLCPDLPDRVENGRRHVQIAWPRSLLRNGSGKLLGFVMPELDIEATSDLEHVLNERQAREAGLPTALGPKLTLAANLAAVVNELHRQRHYVVDFKPLNLRFYRESLYVAMLDCDGFSIQGSNERFPAGHFTADYLAPELHGSSVGSSDEEAQDRFALAVVVFQLLNFGIHPYSGRSRDGRVPTDLPGRIRGNHYAYGRTASRSALPMATSGHAQMPDSLRKLFDRAFAGSPGDRPSALEWRDVLQRYAVRQTALVVTCAANREHQHFVGQGCGACHRERVIAKAASAAPSQRRRREQERQRRRPPGTRTHAPQPRGTAGAHGPLAQAGQTAPTSPGVASHTLSILLGAPLLALMARIVSPLPPDPEQPRAWRVVHMFAELFVSSLGLGLLAIASLIFLVLALGPIMAKRP